MRRFAIAVIGIAFCVVAPAGPAAAKDDALAPKLRAALVRLHVTSQSYERTAPWKLGNEYTRTGRGVVVGDGLILTKSSLVANQRMIEISIANSARRFPGKLRHVDRRVGLALIEFDDDHLKKALGALSLGEPVKLDDEFDIHYLGRDNIPERTQAQVIRAIAGSTGLDLQLRASLSDSGDGQVALSKDGKIVGLVTSTYGSRQQATILSIETIRQYMDDLEDDAYHGRPGPGFWTHQLLRQDLRTFYGLAENQHGIAISRVVPGRTGDGVLQENDVLLSVDGYDIDDEGKFVHEVHGRLSSSYLLSGRRYAGDRVKAKILRDGAEIEVEFELKGQKPGEKSVPDGYGAGRPQFMVIGGLVLLELTSSSGISRSSGGVLLRRFRERANWDPPTKRKRVIYVDRILQDVSNKGFEDVYHQPIKTINGIEINDFEGVPKALETPEGKYHVFRFDGLESDYVIEAAKLDEINKRITDKYKVTRMRYLEGDED
jgi:S1-C subfamily serine protease